MSDNLNDFSGYANDMAYGNEGIFDEVLGSQGQKAKSSNVNTGSSEQSQSYSNTSTADSNLYNGAGAEQSIGSIIEGLNSALSGNQGSQSLTSYSNSGLSQLNSNTDSSDSFAMQTITSGGCGCASCSGGAPANIISDSDGGSVTTSNDTIINSGGGGGGANSGKPFGSADDIADYLIDGYWADINTIGHSWTDTNLTFSISNSYSAAQKAGIRMAFDQWEDVADLSFTEVGSGGDIDVRVGPVDDGAYSAGTWNGSGEVLTNYISIDTSKSYWQDFNVIGDYAMITMIHEIGHSLGFGHTGNYNGSANYTNDATYSNDTRQYSVMSYFDADNSGADHSDSAGWQYASTPLLYDIYAMQEIYGANNTTRSGDTTYGFNSTAGRNQFDFTITDDPVVAIWDAGGTDTLDLSGYSVTQTIRLGEGEFSNVGGMTGNLAIAYDTVIENAVGGSGADTIYGNDANNVILGGNGNDIIFGSSGDDTLNGQGGSGDTANYSFSVTAFAFDFIDSVTVAFEHIAQAWTDTLSNIENFIFTDGTYTFAQLEAAFDNEVNDFAPVVTANDLTLDVGATALASSVVTASDADGNTLTYEIFDSGQGKKSGHFELNGTQLAHQTIHSLTQSEFDDLLVVGGDFDGIDALWVRASDGIHTTTWDLFRLTTDDDSGAGFLNTAPDITANNLTLDQSESVQASDSITVNDVDGQTLTYQVWDSGTDSDSGYFELNGTRLSAGVSHNLSQADFDNLLIVGGSTPSTNEKLWINANDGVETTAWELFYLTTTSTPVGGSANTAPTMTVNDLTLNHDASVLASSIINANDVDGDALTYEVWDGGYANSSGYFELNGSKLAAGSAHSLSQAQFDSLLIYGGSRDITDNLYFKISDGTVSTTWQKAVLTTAGSGGGGGGGNVAPVATANDLSVASGSNVLASTALSATDADGDTLSYQVWDGGTKSNTGYFELNGVRLSAGGAHDLTQADFDSLLIYGGSSTGTEKMWFRALDGTVGTTWSAFNLTTTAPSSAPAPSMISGDDILDNSNNDGLDDAIAEFAANNSPPNIIEGELYGGDVFSSPLNEDLSDNNAMI